MKQPNVTLYGSQQCDDTRRAREHLDGLKVAYEFKDVDESPEYNDYIAHLNGGKRVTPTIRIDNETLVNPPIAQLDEAIHQAASERP